MIFKQIFSIKAVPACLAALAIMICLLPAAVSAAPDQGPIPEYTEFEQLSGCNIGMITGAPFEELVRSKIPDAGPVLYYNSPADLVTALKAGKVEAYFNSNAVGSLQVNQDRSLALFPHSLGETNFGFAFKKNSKERQRWERAFSTISEEEKQKIWEKWTGADESVKVLPEQDWPGTAGTVKVAACDTLPPMSYRGPNGKLAGFDIEIILRMAKELDVHVEFKGMEFSAVLPSVESGMAPMGTGSIVVSPERKEVVDFIEYHPASYVLIVRSLGNEETGVGFFAGLKQSFYRTFIKDKRYRLVLSGFLTTLITSFMSGIFGLILAFCLVFLRHKDSRLINRLIGIYTSLVAGIPAVVILMVLYYIVFGKSGLSAIIVAIIGFSIIFAARAFGVIWNTLEGIDPGQREAALALGYTEARAFRELILPQAQRGYRPLLVAQFVSLVKETSIAGYITVVELTRAGDLIRSRTMEAFFPLLSIALIYFVLIWLLERIAGLLDKHLAKKHEERKIKGVDA